jgi:hypothetical protein
LASPITFAFDAWAWSRNDEKSEVGNGVLTEPTTLVHWTYDTVALANGTGSAMVKRGGDTWYFLTADYAFGQALQRVPAPESMNALFFSRETWATASATEEVGTSKIASTPSRSSQRPLGRLCRPLGRGLGRRGPHGGRGLQGRRQGPRLRQGGAGGERTERGREEKSCQHRFPPVLPPHRGGGR